MASKEVKTKVSLDASSFTRGTNQVRRNIKQLERGLTIDFAKAARIGRRGILALGAAGAAVGVGIAAGVNSVIKLGATLDHLSSQTGVAVRDLVILRQAFEDSGVSSEKVGMSVNRMQKAMIDAENGLTTAQRAFDALGVSVQDLQQMDATQQFNTIGAAIMQLDTQAERAAVAMDIFGRSGAKLLTVFQDGAIDDAASSLGEQAALLEKNSKLFERAGTLLDRAGTKVRGFFVGIADQVVPVILPLLEKFDQLDLAGQGQRFGEGLKLGIQAIIGLFEGGKFGEVIGLALKIGAKTFINTLARGFTGLINGIAQGLWGALKNIFGNIKDFFMGTAKMFTGLILEGIGRVLEKIPTFGDAGADLRARGENLQIRGAGETTRSADGLVNLDFIDKFTEGFEKGMAELDGIDILGTDADKAKLAELIRSAITKGGKDVVEAEESAARKVPGLFERDEETTGAGQQGPAISSLAAIGGGGNIGAVGGIETLVDKSQKQIDVLQRINDNVKASVDALLNPPRGPQMSTMKLA